MEAHFCHYKSGVVLEIKTELLSGACSAHKFLIAPVFHFHYNAYIFSFLYIYVYTSMYPNVCV